MESKLPPLIIYVRLALFCFVVRPCTSACDFPAIFSFGDSLTDTGNAIKTSPAFFFCARLPYGETFFHHGALRFSDGRLLVDFLATSVGLPFLEPYLAYKRAGADFSNGVNYAVAGASVQGEGSLLLNGGANILTLDNLQVQLGWHLRIKSISNGQGFSPGLKLPSPESFSRGLYFLAIGGNDYGSVFIRENLHIGSPPRPSFSNTRQLQLVPLVVGKFTEAVETLYANEARNFFILNIGPEGCAPFYLDFLNGTLDEFGCLAAVNQVALAHNQMLQESLEALEQKYSDINFFFADYNSAYTNVLRNPSAHGFTETVNACCGAGPTAKDGFKLLTLCLKGRSYICPNPSVYVQWDGVHQTDAFHQYVMNQFVSAASLNSSNVFSCATKV